MKLLCAILAFCLLPFQMIYAEDNSNSFQAENIETSGYAIDSTVEDIIRSLWNEKLNYMDVTVQITDEDALRYMSYYEDTFPHAAGYAALTLEERQQESTVVEPQYDALPQDGDVPWKDALITAYGWIEQNGYLQDDDFLHYVVSTYLFGMRDDPHRMWFFIFNLYDEDVNSKLINEPSILIYIDAQTGHVIYTGGSWNAKD